MPRPHVSDGELVRYHDGTLHDAERCQTIEQHLAHCRECHRRRDAVRLIHPSAEELMAFHDGTIRNRRTYERVKAHLHDHNCPLCGGWLEALRQAQEEVAQGDEAALWQDLSPWPQTTAAVLPPVSPAVTQRLSTRVPRQGEAVECHVQEGANGDLTLVLRGSPPLAGRLLEFALLAEDTGRICLSGFSVLPDADGNLTSTVHVSREALAARLGHTAVRAVAYPLELADLSIHDVMTLCWSVTMADKATQPAWGALCRRWQKLVPAGSLLHAWAEEVARALGQDQQDTKATAPATPEPKRRQHPPQLRLIGRGTEHRGGAQHRRASRPVGRRFQGKPPREQEVGELLYAAEMTQAALPEERLREPLARIPLGTFEFAGVRYEVLADAQGQVLLSPAPEPGKTHLVLEGVSYLLERLEGEEALCRVIGVERGQLGLFFARRRTEQAQHYIGFE